MKKNDMICIRHLRRSFLGLLFLLGLAQICEAQGTRNAAALSRRDDFSRLVNSVRSMALEKMPAPEQRILREIDIRIPMDRNATRVQAFRDESGQRIIEMSFGFLIVMTHMSADCIFADLTGEWQKLDAYLDYVNEIVERNERMLSSDDIKSFQEYAEIPAEKWDAITGRDDYWQSVGAMSLSAIGFILTHEIGHHVLGQVDRPPPGSPAESRRYEAQADRYAVALTVKMGITALGALPALAFFATHEGQRVDSDATHPLALCRVLEAFSATFDQIGFKDDSAKIKALYNQRCK